ncbi:LON peptidase substrate-binding domain-containing protein [Thalassospira sp. TSL5-1]|uniref:LON peptidase substrate-binding domain-containing protein n=1 Tax=Thalassospira sp. TSL5-1 TaxID=1544451 RepID=UPI00093DE0FA|nr:LON peptidase substrate-binding domain-containing protein [Thalassospira sp. TSL5-1]OKH87588.1 peptidase S16 [Thalassospira sp. TSL5-1]
MNICGPFDPDFSELPATLPVFPLSGALLLPRGHLPLNIFEPRYLNMTIDALGRNRMIGMVQPRHSDISDTLNLKEHTPQPELFKTGCVGRISAFSETDDGRFLITLTGVCRFDISSELPVTQGGYRSVECDYSRWRGDLDNAISANGPPLNRSRLQRALDAYFAHHSLRSCWDTISDTDDEMLVTAIAMGCQLDPLEKQALLECPSLYDRGDMLTALLEMACHPQTSKAAGN